MAQRVPLWAKVQAVVVAFLGVLLLPQNPVATVLPSGVGALLILIIALVPFVEDNHARAKNRGED